MDKDEMKELIRKGDIDQILQHDQLRVSRLHAVGYKLCILSLLN
jgi:hypothetical protein